MPATTISDAPSGAGALTPGSTSHTTPATAAAMPSARSGPGRSPRASPTPIIVTCTAPNSSSAPVPASSET